MWFWVFSIDMCIHNFGTRCILHSFLPQLFPFFFYYNLFITSFKARKGILMWMR